MKGKIIISVILLIFLLSFTACVKEPKQIETKEEIVEEDSQVKEIVDDVTEDKEEIEETSDSIIEEKTTPKPIKEIDSDIKELLEKGSSYKQISFKYGKSPYLTKISEVYIRNNKIKIVLPDEDIYKKEELYTAVYLDSSDKSSFGYCEDEVKCPDLTREFSDITYESQYIKTPVDWAKSIEYAEEVGGENLFGRSATIIEFEINGKTARASIDDFYGVPLKVITDYKGNSETTQIYEIIRVGNIDEGQVNHQIIFK